MGGIKKKPGIAREKVSGKESKAIQLNRKLEYSGSDNGITTYVFVRNGVANYKIVGTTTTELGTMGGFAACGLLQYKPTREIAKRIYSDGTMVLSHNLKITTDGHVFIGFTQDEQGDARNIPAGSLIIIDETFVF